MKTPVHFAVNTQKTPLYVTLWMIIVDRPSGHFGGGPRSARFALDWRRITLGQVTPWLP